MRECATQISCNVWVWKYRAEPGLFKLVVGGYTESFDIFLGVIESYFLSLLLGYP